MKTPMKELLEIIESTLIMMKDRNNKDEAHNGTVAGIDSVRDIIIDQELVEKEEKLLLKNYLVGFSDGQSDLVGFSDSKKKAP